MASIQKQLDSDRFSAGAHPAKNYRLQTVQRHTRQQPEMPLPASAMCPADLCDFRLRSVYNMVSLSTTTCSPERFPPFCVSVVSKPFSECKKSANFVCSSTSHSRYSQNRHIPCPFLLLLVIQTKGLSYLY